MKKTAQNLFDNIESEFGYTRHITGIQKLDDRVMTAMKKVPREQFVPEALIDYAYDNDPLPIGWSQTISQPYIVALMTQLLSVKEEHRVLEIGTGSGYQAAVLAQLCHRVYTVERVQALKEKAIERFKALKYTNIDCLLGNGCYGWEDNAPYDRIIVTAAAEIIPDALIKQLKVGGKLVMPVGARQFDQKLTLVQKNEKNMIDTRTILDVVFVPLVDGELEEHKTEKK